MVAQQPIVSTLGALVLVLFFLMSRKIAVRRAPGLVRAQLEALPVHKWVKPEDVRFVRWRGAQVAVLMKEDGPGVSRLSGDAILYASVSEVKSGAVLNVVVRPSLFLFLPLLIAVVLATFGTLGSWAPLCAYVATVVSARLTVAPAADELLERIRSAPN